MLWSRSDGTFIICLQATFIRHYFKSKFLENILFYCVHVEKGKYKWYEIEVYSFQNEHDQNYLAAKSQRKIIDKKGRCSKGAIRGEWIHFISSMVKGVILKMILVI